VRMLKLPDAVRRKYDVSTLRCVIHAAAPCPVDVKHRMMDWFGPIIHEYYGGTEGFAGTTIGPEEWLAHPGSVGIPMAQVHVVGDDGEELPVGESGENVLIMHPKLVDAAVFGVPNDEFGEEVKAVVQPAPGIAPGPDLEAELIEYCRAHLAGYKCPRTVEFVPELPRDPNGKLYKRRIRERYWQGRASKII